MNTFNNNVTEAMNSLKTVCKLISRIPIKYNKSQKIDDDNLMLLDNEEIYDKQFTGKCDYKCIFIEYEFPTNWMMFYNIKYKRDVIINKVNEAFETLNKDDGSYGCLVCNKIFFIVENNKITKWSKYKIKQKMIQYHNEYKFGVRCPECYEQSTNCN